MNSILYTLHTTTHAAAYGKLAYDIESDFIRKNMLFDYTFFFIVVGSMRKTALLFLQFDFGGSAAIVAIAKFNRCTHSETVIFCLFFFWKSNLK